MLLKIKVCGKKHRFEFLDPKNSKHSGMKDEENICHAGKIAVNSVRMKLIFDKFNHSIFIPFKLPSESI